MNTQKTNTNLKRMAICLLASSFALTSCTSLQQSTSVASDDLYYTPNNKSVEQAVVQTEEDTYQDYQNYQDDRYLRLKVANRNRWSGIDDFGYWNDPRYNNSFYPSYMGWNSWYTGYYGASWYSPFGPSYSMGWGGYSPYMSSYGFGMGWGYDDFAFGYGGYGGFGFGGFGYGGFGYSRYGWNPYTLGYWNPYGSYFYGGGYGGMNGGYMSHGGQYQQRIPVQPNRTNLAAYNNVRNFNGAGASRPINGLNTSRNVNSNSGSNNSNNFGSLIRRSLNSNTNNNSSRFSASERQSRFSNSNTNNNFNSNTNRQFNSAPSSSNNVGNSGGSSGGSAPRATGNFVGGGRRGGGR